jgi:protein SCO1/2
VRAALARLLLAAVMLSGGAAWAGLAAGDLSEFAFRPHPGAHLPLAAELVDEAGREAALGQFFTGRPVILLLDYLRCKTLCGVTLENLVAALDTLPLAAGRDFAVAVISIDPRDGPAELEAAKRKYLAAFRHPVAERGWHFLTGPQPVVARIADAVGFPYRYEPELDQYIHPAGFVVAAPDGGISQYMLGLGVQPAELESALADAAQGKTIGLLQRLLLLCHGDSPQSGRYSLAIEGAFVAANLAAIAGGVGVFVAIWRRRHG